METMTFALAAAFVAVLACAILAWALRESLRLARDRAEAEGRLALRILNRAIGLGPAEEGRGSEHVIGLVQRLDATEGGAPAAAGPKPARIVSPRDFQRMRAEALTDKREREAMDKLRERHPDLRRAEGDGGGST